MRDTSSMMQVQEVMSPDAHVIDMTASLADARRLMRLHGVRHLPVMDDGALVGILSDRDLGRMESFAALATDLRVADAMTPNPYVVAPEMPLEEVVQVMYANRYGSAIVAREERVLGIFTSTDALGLLLCRLESVAAAQPRRAVG